MIVAPQEKKAKNLFNSLVFNPKIKKSSGVKALKDACDFSAICSISEQITESSHLYKYFFANPLPHSYEELGYIEEKKYISASSSFEQEVNWAIMSIRKFKEKIISFLNYKRDFEKALLLGEYMLAFELLTKIECEICYSLWSLESRFLLLEQSGSPDGHKLFLSDFNKSNRGFFTPYLATHISNRAERNFSVLKFNSEITAVLSNFNGKSAEANKQYYYFKLNFYHYKDYSEYSQILAFESHHSIIDRYLTLSKLLKIVYCDKKSSGSTRDFIVAKASYLVRKFDEESLKGIITINEPKALKRLDDKSFNLSAIDLYTRGLFEDAIIELGKELHANPHRFEYYPLYVKSFIYSGKKFVVPSGEGVKICLQNTILFELLGQLTKSVNPNTSSISIERFIKNLSAHCVSEGLYNFFCNEYIGDTYWSKFNILSNSIHNPITTNFIEEDSKESEYIANLSFKHKDSITIEYFAKRNLLNQIEIYENLNIPEFSKKVVLGKIHQASGDIALAIEIWEELVSTCIHLIPVYETAITQLFACYAQNNEIDKAIVLHVDNYIINEFIIQKIKHSDLRKTIRKNKFKTVSPSINLPLFYTICEADENEIHITYEKFLDAVGVEKASELDKISIQVDKTKLVLFLSLTCSTELFKHSIYIEGSKEGIHERIAICRQLQGLDQKHTDEYKNEIDSLTNILIVQEGLQQLDESKIYVNVQGLINSELKEFEGLFNRYKTIARIFNNGMPLTFFVQNSTDLAMKSDSKAGSTARFSDHPLKDAFKEIFDVIIDKFLHSKFGISAYLSTRIRHGVLLGEVRPVFETYHLISQFDKNEAKYRDVEYWNIRYPYVDETKTSKLQASIGYMSAKVDNLIQDLIKNNLQIGLQETVSNAWFDYYFDDITMTLYSVNLKNVDNYNDFIKKTIEFLWERTDKNLENIRHKIQGEVKNSFNEMISDFTTQLKTHYISGYMPEVFTNINTCSTDVQNSIERIASWFNRSGSQTSDFNISKVINIVLEKINQSYPSKNLEYTVSLDTDVLIKGEYYSHIADMFRIFFDNALIHSQDEYDRIPIDVTASCENGWLSIDIKNMYPDPLKTGNITQQNEQKVNINKISSEGKSGFHKALKIIKSDLKYDRNECFREIDSDGKYCVNLKISLDKLVV